MMCCVTKARLVHLVDGKCKETEKLMVIITLLCTLQELC